MREELQKVKEVEALMKAIRDNPEDDTARLVLADWVDENLPDEKELSSLLRGEARKWLEEFAEEYSGVEEYEDEEEDEDGNWTTVMRTHDEYAWADYAYLLEEGARCLKGEEAVWVGKDFNCGNVQGLADALNDRETRKMFWTCISVMTGIPIPADFDGKGDYDGSGYGRCAC